LAHDICHRERQEMQQLPEGALLVFEHVLALHDKHRPWRRTAGMADDRVQYWERLWQIEVVEQEALFVEGSERVQLGEVRAPNSHEL